MSFLREFFEDPDGKSSMARLSMLLLTVCACGVSAAWVVAVLQFPERMSAEVTAGFGAILGALVANGVVALRERTTRGDYGARDSDKHSEGT